MSDPLFQMHIGSETLSKDELSEITGCTRKADQLAWLKTAGWVHLTTRAGEPVVGRWYARMRLAGVEPADTSSVIHAKSRPNFAALD